MSVGIVDDDKEKKNQPDEWNNNRFDPVPFCVAAPPQRANCGPKLMLARAEQAGAFVPALWSPSRNQFNGSGSVQIHGSAVMES